ncbi:hypothetical protein F0P96_19650 [Hymenobacter busanensis]|uniref:Uncharacterized protein n=1 Tax=Hymenobacter busanensis TaxID=2607656 RepID=A0A7L4ZX11_9BACT|nr:hypothetical protein [Hymenobacter busanensis]KAA9325548.1 hypothetical protein F0P96_19650 [Hymenobacter busanensis]QHJ07781.1 hypothetical protein GUY19_11015 [Hymenobacter busanensis]
MKTLSLSALLLLPALATTPALAQTRTTAKPVAKTTAAKPAATASKSTAAAKPGTAAKPAPKPVAVVETPTAPVESTKPAAQPAAKAAPKSSSSSMETFTKGSTAVNLGVGVGLGYGYGFGTIKATPAMSLSVERGFIDGVGPGTIGIGGLVGYKGYHYDYSGGYKASWSNILVSARGTYHYNILENPKLDTYAGLSVGVRVESYKNTYFDNTPGYDGYKSSSSYITSGLFIGGRYFFTDNIGAFAELGYDMNYLKLGLSAKF